MDYRYVYICESFKASSFVKDNHSKCVLYFDVVLQLNIELKYIFMVSGLFIYFSIDILLGFKCAPEVCFSYVAFNKTGY